MRFSATGIEGAKSISLERHTDRRGIFTRTWCAESFEKAGIGFRPVQSAASTTHLKGTVRGMHFQRAPHSEAKLVRCSRGRIWDAMTDLRPDSKTYLMSFGLELNDRDGKAVYIPSGCAHGFQALCDDVVVEYFMDDVYTPELADGFRYDDPDAGIEWPLPVALISERDLGWAPLSTRDLRRSASRSSMVTV